MPTRAGLWTGFWAGLALLVAGNLAWILSHGVSPIAAAILAAASVVFNIAAIALLCISFVRLRAARRDAGRHSLTISESGQGAPEARATASFEELDGLWKRGARLSATTLLVAGPIVWGLASWWVQIAFLLHRANMPALASAVVALFLYGLGGWAFYSGVWYYRIRPSTLIVNEIGIRVTHVNASAFELKWSDRPIRLSMSDLRRNSSVLDEGTPPSFLNIGLRRSYAVPPRIIDAILGQLVDHNLAVRRSSFGTGPDAWVRLSVRLQ